MKKLAARPRGTSSERLQIEDEEVIISKAVFFHNCDVNCVKFPLSGVNFFLFLEYSATVISIWQIFGSVLGVSAGFVVGKEGPMVHTGACIASILGQGGSRKYHLTWKWLRYFKNDRDRRDLITCGAAAGVAAAFRAPVGGVLFALEEAASWYIFLLSS